MAKAGSFRKASLTLRRTQPSISRSVQVLEDRLGEPLFVRSKKGVQPTRAGILLLEFSDRLAAEIVKVAHRIHHMKTELSARLVVGSYSSLAVRIWPGLVRSLAKKYPELSISLKTDCDWEAFKEMLLSTKLDLVVNATPKAHPALAQRLLYTETLSVFSSRTRGSHQFRRPGVHSVEALARNPLILVPTALCGGGSSLEQTAHRLGLVRGQLVYELDSFEAAREFIGEGIGIGLLPERVGLAGVKAGKLVRLAIRGQEPRLSPHDVVASFRKSDISNPALMALLEETRNQLSST